MIFSHRLILNKRAETGIGTLIIFIAMLIVASITANVLIQTATSLQNKALLTGNQAKESVSNFVQVMAITASNGTDNNLEDFRVQLKLAPGSSGISLSDALLSMGISDWSIDLVYTSNNCEYDIDTGYYTNSTYNNGTYSVKYISKSSDHQDGVLQRGEIVELCFRALSSIGEDNEVMIKFVPKTGIPSQSEFVTPSVIVNNIERLFP